MIAGLYNTTSLLVEPTQALGSLLRAADGGARPLSPQQAEAGLAHHEFEAGPAPDRLPAGVIHFVPVVVRILEQTAIAAAAAESRRAEAGTEREAAEGDGEPVPTPETHDRAARRADPPDDAAHRGRAETVGAYVITAAADGTEPRLDTVI